MDFVSEPKSGETESFAEALGYDVKIVSDLTKDGFNAHYIDAMLNKGLDLRKPKPLIGGSYAPRHLWERNIRRALAGHHIAYEPKIMAQMERRLRKHDLLLDHKNGGCISLNPRWPDLAPQALKQYLLLQMRYQK